jgi:8-oxo-dGTP pyrophosphatase MutT (NUDIX family)
MRGVGDTVSIAGIREALAHHEPRSSRRVGSARKAAVAAVLREIAGAPELLFIRRAEHPRDRWSGQMAFPGGRVDPGDADPLSAAIREAHEEVALDLERSAELIGRLSEVSAHRRGSPTPLTIVPFVFELREDVALRPNHEVQETVWVPVGFLAERGNRGSMIWKVGGVPVPMSCYRFEGRVIWGLTLRMVDELLGVIARV